ncbi:hypothetical protein [Acidithiobacillus caldus]|uniref:hypothetical protein n=1 Tax=Acidithiobacillus caldus TaxID=33059 RepID=UPI00114C9134|nr:hypothetical protein [Acidithiobacillus caldus]
MESRLGVERGKRERDKKKYILFNRPWDFESDEFERLCNHFHLSRAECYDLTAMRLERLAKKNHEAEAVLSIIHGGNGFREIMAKGRRKCFTVITSDKPSLPQ